MSRDVTMNQALGLQAHLLAAAPSSAGGILDAVEQWLLTLGANFIDTPEERAAIVAVVMQFYDQVTAGKVGIFARIIRGQVQNVIESVLESWAKHQPAPAPTPAPTPPAAI